jgi:two-component system CheB/CheR fusion protein
VFGFSPKERALGVAVDLDRRQEQTTQGVPDITKEVDRFIVERYSPAGVVVNKDLTIVQVRGETGPYLTLAPGEVSVDVLKMAKEDLSLELRKALHEAKKSGRPVQKQGLQVRTNDRYVGVNVEVVPLTGHTAEERCFLILFEVARALVSETETRSFAKWLRSLLGAGVRGEPRDEHKKSKE